MLAGIIDMIKQNNEKKKKLAQLSGVFKTLSSIFTKEVND